MKRMLMTALAAWAGCAVAAPATPAALILHDATVFDARQLGRYKALHDEMAVDVRAGLRPAQALRSAVVAGPRCLGKLDGYGALADIAATRQIEAVMSRGRLLDRRLDTMLDEVRDRVAKP